MMYTFDFLLNHAAGCSTLNDLLQDTSSAVVLLCRLVVLISLGELRLLQQRDPGTLWNPRDELLRNSLEQR